VTHTRFPKSRMALFLFLILVAIVTNTKALSSISSFPPQGQYAMQMEYEKDDCTGPFASLTAFPANVCDEETIFLCHSNGSISECFCNGDKISDCEGVPTTCEDKVLISCGSLPQFSDGMSWIVSTSNRDCSGSVQMVQAYDKGYCLPYGGGVHSQQFHCNSTFVSAPVFPETGACSGPSLPDDITVGCRRGYGAWFGCGPSHFPA